MAQAQAGHVIPAPTGPEVYNRPTVLVKTKAVWSGEWELQEHLRPLNASWSIMPTIGAAEFVYDFANRTSENAPTTLMQRDPLDLKNKYVRIEIYPANGTTMVATWVGQFVTDTRHLSGVRATTGTGDPPLEGRQHLTAYGLEHLLRKCPIDMSHFFVPGGSTVMDSFNAIDFNAAGPDGSLIGNRSQNPIATDPLVYVFDREGFVWTHAEIIRYLLHFFVRTRLEPEFKFSVFDTSGIGYIETHQSLFGPRTTVFDAINTLVDPRRGFGWYIRTDGEPGADGGAGKIDVQVFNYLTEEIAIDRFDGSQSVILPNPRSVIKRYDRNRLIDDYIVTDDGSAKYDRVTVRGAPIKVAFSVGYADDNLVEGWSTDAENAYRDGASNTSGYNVLIPEEQRLWNDSYRQSQEAVRHVFMRHVLPPGFDWLVGQNTGNGTPFSAIPVPKEDGTVLTLTGATQPIADWTKTLLRNLPLQRNTDYSTIPPTIDDDPLDPNYREFLAPLVFVKDWYWRYRQVDMMTMPTEKGGHLPAASVRILDRGLGFELKLLNSGHQNHHYARETWLTPPAGLHAPEPSTKYPRRYDAVDYRELVATLAIETDARPYMTIQNQGTSPHLTELVIDVPNVEYWYAAPFTIVGLKPDNPYQFEYLPAANSVLRDDTPRLRTLAKIAAKWYGVPRRSIQYTVALFDFVQPGTMLKAIALGQPEDVVNSVVSRVVWNFDTAKPTTTVATQHAELDFNSIFGRGPRGRGGGPGGGHQSSGFVAGMGRTDHTLSSLTNRLDALEARTGNTTVRDPSAGGITAFLGRIVAMELDRCSVVPCIHPDPDLIDWSDDQYFDMESVYCGAWKGVGAAATWNDPVLCIRVPNSSRLLVMPFYNDVGNWAVGEEFKFCEPDVDELADSDTSLCPLPPWQDINCDGDVI